MRTVQALALLIGITLIGAACSPPPASMPPPATPMWQPDEIAMLRSLWIGSLEPLPANPSNQYADDPQAAALGEQLFFDPRFSANGEVACATCHLPELGFQDGLALSQGVGTTNRRAMTLVGMAYSPWLFWDGRKDSLWAQALGPMENPVEHGGNRTQYAHLIADQYRSEYEAIFGALPDLAALPASAGPVDDAAARSAWDGLSEGEQVAVTQVYVNMGKAIEAYERTLMPSPSRFDAYAEAVINDDPQAADLLTQDEIAGLRLFIGEANCTRCHNGALLTDNDFHNTGVPAAADLPEDTGRALGAAQVQADEFNCLSQWSDASPDDCDELRFMLAEGDQLVRAFKPPSLRYVDGRAPYMHAGQFATLEDVLHHYNTAPDAPAGHSELEPLHLSDSQIQQIIAFLKTLTAPMAWLDGS